MANFLIYEAFERMWQHVVAELNDKADKEDVTSLQSQVDALVATSISVYTGSDIPSPDFGEDGDLYLISE